MPQLSTVCHGSMQFLIQPIEMCEWIAESTLSLQKCTVVATSPAWKPFGLIPVGSRKPWVTCLPLAPIFLSHRKNARCSTRRDGPHLLQVCLS